ncbi:MAG: hypothetical protein AB1774_06765 [Bacillota bacterium]
MQCGSSSAIVERNTVEYCPQSEEAARPIGSPEHVRFDLFEPDEKSPLQKSLVRLVATSRRTPRETRVRGGIKMREVAPLAGQLRIDLVSVHALRVLPRSREALPTGMGLG